MTCFLRFHRKHGDASACLTLTTRDTCLHDHAVVVFADMKKVLGEVKTADLAGRLTVPMPGHIEFSLKEPLSGPEVLATMNSILPQLEHLNDELERSFAAPTVEVVS